MANPQAPPFPTINVESANTARLSPPTSGPRRGSLDAPPSPLTPGSIDGASPMVVPPSPTLSHTSSVVQFNTATNLRDNNPNKLYSPGMLSPTDTIAGATQHGRKQSWASAGGHSGITTISSVDTSESERNPDLKSDASRSNRGSSTTAVEHKEKVKEPEPPEADPDALPQLPHDADTDPAPFPFKPYELAHMLDPKNLNALVAVGGITQLLRGLATDENHGIYTDSQTGHSVAGDQPKEQSGPVPGIFVTSPEDDGVAKVEGRPVSPAGTDVSRGYPLSASLEERRRVYGANILPQRKSKSLLQLMWAALQDKVLVLLCFAAIIAFALGLFQDFGPSHVKGEPRVDWVEGVAIMVAVMIVVIVGSVNDWQKEKQFRVLNEKKDERGVKVIRDGEERVIDIKEVVVGDIALLEPGEIVPCDGIFLNGHNIKCDESGATGESDAIKKLSYDACLQLRNKALGDRAPSNDPEKGDGLEGLHTDCFLISGSKVLEGVGRYVVIAVGQKSFNGRIMMALRTDTENTPLQLKLNNLAELIAKIGTTAGLLLFVGLMIRFAVQLVRNDPPRNASLKGIAFVNILIIAVTLIVVAVPEGLPLAVTLALAFATKRMTKENLLVRVLGSCETMANATVVCTDKTGTLTQNEMTVVAGSVGINAKFVLRLEQNLARTNADEQVAPGSQPRVRKHSRDFSIDMTDLNRVLSPPLRKLFNDAVAINSTAFEDRDQQGQLVVIGNKTETALINFVRQLGWPDFKQARESATVVQMIPFSSERKAMGVVVKLSNSRWRLYVNGASEIMTKLCQSHVVVHQDGNHRVPEDGEVETAPITEVEADNISRTIIFYANQTLRTIAICYRDFDTWPPRHVQYNSPDEVPFDDLAWDLTLIGIVGIEDPLREGVPEAVVKCQRAGVTVKMCTGDNVLTARSIAMQCGIYTAGGIIMEGPIFRQLSDHDMQEVVPRLQVLARSSPEDKKILVEKLKAMGQVVGVTGDGTNDGPALKTADVGFSMGIAGTEIAKEASDIILMDDNFASIVKAIAWGRCVNDAVRKFLQFQIATNVTAVVITFVTALATTHHVTQLDAVMTAVQLLWINIIMDTFAALALATDPASEKLLDRKPDKRTAALFSVDMYKQILFQSLYQIAVILIFHFLGERIIRKEFVGTLVFNTFVFAQIFNSVNCRRLDNKLNIFEGLASNAYFIIITLIEIVVQVVIVFVGGTAFSVVKLPGREWGISLALGVVSIPLGAIVRLLPNGPFDKMFKLVGLLPTETVLPVVRHDAEWNSAITKLRDNLSLYGNIRSGRLNASAYVNKSRHQFQDLDRPGLPSLMAMVPTLVASSVGAGWAPRPGSGLSDPGNFDPSKSSAALWEGKIQIHPDTSPDDPIRRRYGNPGGLALPRSP